MTLFPTYHQFDLEVKKAEGMMVEDVCGKRYLDFGSGIGVCNLGHRHSAVQKAVEDQLNCYWHVSNVYRQPIQKQVADLLTENSIGDNVFFCNSGAEANESAIKLARKVTGKDKIITFNQSFHGRTFATMAATGQKKVQVGYGAMLPTFAYACFNDLESVSRLIDRNTAAIMLEMVQGEGGINPAKSSFVQGLADLCKTRNVLFIADEIQTGIGRTGKQFAYEHYGIEPDIITLAKGLGNGFPVGAMVAKGVYKNAFGTGSHGSTFGGNPLAMAASKAVLETIFTDEFLSEVTVKANYLGRVLAEALTPLENVQEIRQMGLMLGISCHTVAEPFITKALEKGLLVLGAGERVIRLLPPLTITKQDIDQAVAILRETLG